MEFAALAAVIFAFGILFFLKRTLHLNFGLRTLAGAFLGIVIGLIFRKNYTYVAAFGTVYVNALQAFVVPLLLFSVISSITNLGSSIRLRKIGLKSVLFLLLNTLSASLLTLFAATSLHLGRGFHYVIEAAETKQVPTAISAIVSLFPKNLAGEWSGNKVVPILIFGIVVAFAYNSVARKHEDEVKSFKSAVDAANKVFGKTVSLIVKFTPYAVTSLIARAVGRSSPGDLLPLLSVLAVAYVLCALQLFGVESVLVAFVARLNPFVFLKKNRTGRNRRFYFSEQRRNSSCYGKAA